MDSYQDFAYVYDEFMDETPYDLWCERLHNLIQKYGVSMPGQEAKDALETEKNLENVQVAAKKSTAGILRFRFNNYEFVSSLSDVYISIPEDDGTFFVTGDRTYSFGNGQSRETFYMLFKANSSNDSSLLGNYSVAVSVMQDVENPNSFVYKLSKVENLTAQKTGNLASLRLSKSDLKADILISLE